MTSKPISGFQVGTELRGRTGWSSHSEDTAGTGSVTFRLVTEYGVWIMYKV